MKNNFIWADLSTFDLQDARQFYTDCFGWKYQDIGDGYLVCETEGTPAAGLYTMPEKFQRIGMPSFWMSYIHVGHIDQIVDKAKKGGAKIELGPQPAPGGGLVALIRDPAGAGFTCYEGEQPGGQNRENLNAMVWNELHVSSIELVEPFYREVFGWVITQSDEADRYEIRLPSREILKEPFAGIRVTDNAIKGDKEYWGVYFSVADIQTMEDKIDRAGGEVVAKQSLNGRNTVLSYDSQGAAFYLMEEKSTAKTNPQSIEPLVKWRAISGLLIVASAILLEASWVWGVLFLLWVIPDLKSGSTHFLEHVERHKNPVVYWLIVGTWVSLSVYLLLEWVFRL